MSNVHWVRLVKFVKQEADTASKRGTKYANPLYQPHAQPHSQQLHQLAAATAACIGSIRHSLGGGWGVRERYWTRPQVINSRILTKSDLKFLMTCTVYCMITGIRF